MNGTLNDLLTQINGILDSRDQSVSVSMRRMAADYAGLCTDVADGLRRCRELIEKGLLCDAVALDRENTPRLSERARKLNFPRRSEWCGLCALYQLPVPPELDLETVGKLSGYGSSKERDLAGLIMEFRKIARGTAPSRRVELLRKIILASTGDTASWRTNLVNVEKEYFTELFAAAEAALQKKDTAVLTELYAKLSSPKLLTAPDAEKLAALRAALVPLQKEAAETEFAEAVDSLEQPYAAQDFPSLRAAMKKCERLAGNPLLVPSKAQTQIMSDVRNCLLAEEKKENDSAEFAERRSELQSLLENGAAFPEIDHSINACCDSTVRLNRRRRAASKPCAATI